MLRAHVEVIWGWDIDAQSARFQDRTKRMSDETIILVEHHRAGYLEPAAKVDNSSVAERCEHLIHLSLITPKREKVRLTNQRGVVSAVS